MNIVKVFKKILKLQKKRVRPNWQIGWEKHLEIERARKKRSKGTAHPKKSP